MGEIGWASEKAVCTCVYQKGDPFEGWHIDIMAWWAEWGMRPKHLMVLSWYNDEHVMGREFVDEGTDWADVIAYAEAKWRGLQGE